tara:strand:- start:6059 stop:6697 length:639 start_codon:yes stop_codon:yes gene_type:complete
LRKTAAPFFVTRINIMKNIKIGLSSIYNSHHFEAELFNGDSEFSFPRESGADNACRRAAQSLRDMAEKFDMLALAVNPNNATTINSVNKPMSKRAQDFVRDTAVGSDFSFRADRTGTYHEDGTVYFNDQGVRDFTFDNIFDAARYLIDDARDMAYDLSEAVGERLDDGSISFWSESYDDDELDLEDDGGTIYTKAVRIDENGEVVDEDDSVS